MEKTKEFNLKEKRIDITSDFKKIISKLKLDNQRIIVSITMRKKFLEILKPILKREKVTMSAFIDNIIEEKLKEKK